MRVCLTGGAGFIGQGTAAALVRAGHEVVALDSLSPQVHRDPTRDVARFPGQVRVGDVRDAVAVARAVSNCTVVIHLAAETGVGQSMYEPDRYVSVNVEGTGIVAGAVRAQGSGMVLLSSRAVYGQGAYRCPQHGRTEGRRCCRRGSPDASRERDVLAPVSVYGSSKVGAEQEALRGCDGVVPLAVVRPQNVVGRGQAPHNPYTGVLAAFAARLAAGLPPQVYGTGEQTRDFVDVADVATVLVWLAEAMAMGGIPTPVVEPEDGTPGVPVLNVGSGRRTSLATLARLAVESSGRTGLVPVGIDAHRPGDVEHACADLSELESAGAPLPVVPLDVSVDAFLRDVAQGDTVDPKIWDRALEELRLRHGGQ